MGQLEALYAELQGRDAGLAEQRLWGEALRLLVSDACSHWQSERVRDFNAENYHFEQAFDDVCRCGPMIRHCCGFLDLEPEWIRAGFVSWCEEK